MKTIGEVNSQEFNTCNIESTLLTKGVEISSYLYWYR